MRRRYDKLVRDRIPTIVEENGDRPVTHVAGDEEYARRLRDKLLEEAEEYHEDGAIDELADLLEVVAAIAVHEGVTREELDELRLEKRERRGGFADRIVLDRVEDE